MILEQTANEIRRTVVNETHRSKAAHIGSCLSCVDILTYLYFEKMRFDPWESRDIFIMSKGHAALALYSTLAEKGIMNKNELSSKFYSDGGSLAGHLDRHAHKGIEASAGSLGHGLSIGAGLAHSFKLDKTVRNVYILLGDGECQEGSIWEAAAFASKLQLNNLTVIVDANNLQGYARPDDICHHEPIIDKWAAFGWEVMNVDGHNYESIRAGMSVISNKPKAIIARTIKGKGISFMENEMRWHYFVVTDDHKTKALEELK